MVLLWLVVQEGAGNYTTRPMATSENAVEAAASGQALPSQASSFISRSCGGVRLGPLVAIKPLAIGWAFACVCFCFFAGLPMSTTSKT